jgi:hypothetical protein
MSGLQKGQSPIHDRHSFFFPFRAKDTLRLGHRMLIETLAKSLKISDTKRLIGVGLQQMAMMLYRDGEVTRLRLRV